MARKVKMNKLMAARLLHQKGTRIKYKDDCNKLKFAVISENNNKPFWYFLNMFHDLAICDDYFCYKIADLKN